MTARRNKCFSVPLSDIINTTFVHPSNAVALTRSVEMLRGT